MKTCENTFKLIQTEHVDNVVPQPDTCNKCLTVSCWKPLRQGTVSGSFAAGRTGGATTCLRAWLSANSKPPAAWEDSASEFHIKALRPRLQSLARELPTECCPCCCMQEQLCALARLVLTLEGVNAPPASLVLQHETARLIHLANMRESPFKKLDKSPGAEALGSRTVIEG